MDRAAFEKFAGYRVSVLPPFVTDRRRFACVRHSTSVERDKTIDAQNTKLRGSRPDSSALPTVASGVLRWIGKRLDVPRLAAWVVAASTLVPGAASSAEEGLTIRFKASKDPAIRQVQEALVETWGYTGTQYLDVNTNGVDWPRELQASLDKSFEAKRPEDVYNIIDEMLLKLGTTWTSMGALSLGRLLFSSQTTVGLTDDPFTRVLRPNVAGAFENVTEGQVVGMGFQVSKDQQGSLRIVFVADGSPAQQAGIQTGDILIAINGQAAKDFEKLELAALLRLEADVKLERDRQGQEGGVQELQLHLRAKPIEVHPVQYAALPGLEGRKVGYVRLLVFSKNAPKDVAAALRDLQAQAVNSVVLDLRDNVGGVVLSGYEVAQLFLPEGAQFCFVEDGRGASEDVKLVESHQLTTKPMVVLVNGGTASTAELISASLHDNKRATLIGEQTFGKGRTQRIIPLRGGGLLLLSNTLYLTPDHKPVDKVGLAPDINCKPEYRENDFWVSGESAESNSLLDDPCIRLAVDELGDGKKAA